MKLVLGALKGKGSKMGFGVWAPTEPDSEDPLSGGGDRGYVPAFWGHAW